MGLDQKFQCQILEFLKPFYGRGSSNIEKQELTKHPDYDANLKYLYDNNLIEGHESKTIGTTCFKLYGIRITNLGLDFLDNTCNQPVIEKQKDASFGSPVINISHSTVTLGDKNKIHSQSSQNNTTNTAPAQTATIKKILIGLFVTIVGGLILWYLTK